jgi:hypothetical protein
MGEPNEGSVARVEDQYTLIINRGSEHGVKPDMVFAVLAERGDPIIDPENGEAIGELPIEKLRVKVFDVQPKYSRAATFRTFAPATPTISSLTNLAVLSPGQQIPGTRSAASDSAKQLSEPVAAESLSTSLSKLLTAEMENPSQVRQKIAYEAPTRPTEPPVRREVTVNIGDKVREVAPVRRPARQG